MLTEVHLSQRKAGGGGSGPLPVQGQHRRGAEGNSDTNDCHSERRGNRGKRHPIGRGDWPSCTWGTFRSGGEGMCSRYSSEAKRTISPPAAPLRAQLDLIYNSPEEESGNRISERLLGAWSQSSATHGSQESPGSPDRGGRPFCVGVTLLCSCHSRHPRSARL